MRHYTKGKVYPNYYVVIGEDWHFYSVPSQYIGKEVRIVYDSDLVEIYYNHERIAFHRRSYKEHGYTTRMEHIAALAKIREWYPIWVDQCIKMPNDPWTSEILTRKEVELISLAVNAACTTLSAEGTRHHIRAALEAGATCAEIMMIIKIATFLSIHTASLGAPILLEEAKAAGIKQKQKNPASTPVCDKMKAAGQWNTGWDAFFEIDPAWTEAIIAASLPVYTSGIYTPRLAELLSIAVDASITHMYAPGTRRHIQSALQLGVTIEEIMELLKICVSQGIQASNLGFPILAEELERVTTKEKDIASNRTAGVS